MSNKKFIAFRRKRQGKTNYRKRLEMLKSGSLRLVVRTSLKYVNVQLVEYSVDGDKTLLTVNSKELGQFGWKKYGRNIPVAYLAGYLCGKKALKKDIKNAILDQGLRSARQGTVNFSVLKGVIDAGIEIPHDPSIFPSEDRIVGKHISEDVEKMFVSVKDKVEKSEQ